MRKIIKTRGHFPNDDALVKLLWLDIVDMEDKLAAERARQAATPAQERADRGGTLDRGCGHSRLAGDAGRLDAKWPGRIPVTAI